MRQFRIIALLAICLSPGFATLVQAKPPASEAERDAAMKTIVWRDGQVLTLPLSSGILKAPANFRQVVGKDAATIYETSNGLDAPTGTEAMIYDSQGGTVVYYQKLGSGFIKIDDWPSLDPDAMLKEIIENTERGNPTRKSRGIGTLKVLGWLQAPSLDIGNHSVRWAIDAVEEDGSSLVNSIALVLGRDGYEKLTWIGSKSDFSGNALKVGLDSFSFSNGKRYSDYVEGDKVAEYGIAGLVATALGVKAATKFGMIAFLAVFAKKAGALLIVPLLAVFGLVRRLFRRRAV